MYTKATIDFTEPDSVVMAITDFVEYVKDLESKAESEDEERATLESDLKLANEECARWESQATAQEFEIKRLKANNEALEQRVEELENQ